MSSSSWNDVASDLAHLRVSGMSSPSWNDVASDLAHLRVSAPPSVSKPFLLTDDMETVRGYAGEKEILEAFNHHFGSSPAGRVSVLQEANFILAVHNRTDVQYIDVARHIWPQDVAFPHFLYETESISLDDDFLRFFALCTDPTTGQRYFVAFVLGDENDTPRDQHHVMILFHFVIDITRMEYLYKNGLFCEIPRRGALSNWQQLGTLEQCVRHQGVYEMLKRFCEVAGRIDPAFGSGGHVLMDGQPAFDFNLIGIHIELGDMWIRHRPPFPFERPPSFPSAV
jgi:hypothetical protein